MSSETSLPWLVQNKPSAPIRRVENKVGFLERQFHSEKLSFVHKKETEHSFELSLSICVFYRRIFNLECKTLVLKTTTWWTHACHFVDGWHFKVSNRFLPSPSKWLTRPLDVWRGVGYGWFYSFSLRIFFSILRHERYFFQRRIFFPRNLFACFFPLEISLQDIYFFWNHPITCAK